MPAPDLPNPMIARVDVVLRWGYPLEILDAVVGLIEVLVVGLMAGWTRTKECRRNKSMNPQGISLAVFP